MFFGDPQSFTLRRLASKEVDSKLVRCSCQAFASPIVNSTGLFASGVVCTSRGYSLAIGWFVFPVARRM